MLPQISHQLATVGWQQRLVGNDNEMIQGQPHTHFSIRENSFFVNYVWNAASLLLSTFICFKKAES